MDWFTLLFGSIVALIQNQSADYKESDRVQSFPASFTEYYFPKVETYDFIVVGGGTAGCVVAGRLSENPDVRVLLLEAGGTPPPQTEVPAFAPDSREASNIVFPYATIPQVNAHDKIMPAKVGRILGGTSTINYMFFNRGHPYDFDNWANITGDPAWSYVNVLKYFNRIENYQGEFPLTDQHGRDGPLPITTQEYAPGKEVWLAAGLEKGIQTNDPNGPQTIGFNPVEYNKLNGRRVSSYTGYIKSFESTRKSLVVKRYAEVNEILIDDNNQAYGVTFTWHGVYQTAISTKEVILSAGTYGTPQILLKSGIGPADILKKLNVNPKAILPVGENLQDHPIVPVKILVNDESTMFDPVNNLNEQTMSDFIEKGLGPLSSTSTLTAQGFVASAVAQEEGFPDWPDIQFSLYSQNFESPVSVNGEKAIFVYPYLGRPKSRGKVWLDNNQSENLLKIDFNVLSDDRDIRIIREAITRTLSLIESTSAYQAVGASYSDVPFEACQHLSFRSDAYWECYIRHMVISGNHPSGTCRMGYGGSDSKAVVDSQLRVIGVNRLRIADASIMPDITNANIQAAVFMIGEKLADDLKQDWGV